MRCAFCERELVCDSCETPYVPADEATYQGAFDPETTLYCPRCEDVLVCHWCHTPYAPEDEQEEQASA